MKSSVKFRTVEELLTRGPLQNLNWNRDHQELRVVQVHGGTQNI